MKNKKEKTKSSLWLDAMALFLITLVSGLALSYIYEITKAPIEEQLIQKALKANRAVFTEASTFTPDDELIALIGSTDLTELNLDYKGITIDEISKAYNSSNEILGYNVTVTTSNGYAKPITMVFGYSLDGSITGIEMLSIAETAGLGMKAKDPQYLSQYLGKKVSQFEVTKVGAAGDEQIDAISGATITTKAVTDAINAGIAFVNTYATELGGAQNE